MSVAFIGAGAGFATWISRIAQVKEQLALSAGRLGLLLLFLSLGSLLALPCAGLVVSRLGTRAAVSAMSALFAVGLATAGVGSTVAAPVVAGGLFAMGVGLGTWDVAMNVEGAAVERALGRAILSRLHAGASLGAAGAAVLGAGCVAADVPVALHLCVVAAAVAVTVPWSARNYLRATPPPVPLPATVLPQVDNRPRAWTDSRTLMIGVVALCAAFAEGVGNDWLAVGINQGYATSAAVGSLSFALFVSAMVTGRWFGPQAIQRWGRVRTLRAAALLCLAGVLAVVYGQVLPLAWVGVLAWGLGASIGFPVSMSAGADDPVQAGARVSVIASIGYLAFLAGPPLVGFVGDRVGVLRALLVVSVAAVVGALAAGSTRPVMGEAVMSGK